MDHDRRNASELTPLGGLQEGGIHRLLGYQLAQASIVSSEAFDRVVGEPLGLRPVEFTILQLVHDNASATTTHLAKALAVTPPGVASWLDRLEGRGLIERKRSEVDRRSQHLRVTRKGADLVARALSRLLHADSEMLRHLSEGERHMLLELLHKVAVSRASDR